MNRKLRVTLAALFSVAVAAVILFLLFRSGPDAGELPLPPDRAGGAAGQLAPIAESGDAAKASAGETPAAPGDEEKAPAEAPPALHGTVSGERGPLPGATVNVYPFAMVKELIHKYESISVSGLGDIPALIGGLKQDILGLKSRGIGAVTTSEGKYAFKTLPPGEYTFLVLGPGHIFRAGDSAFIQKDASCERNFLLSAGQSIAGKVVDPQGNGVAGASVLALYQVQGFGGIGKLVRKGLAFLNGEFLKGPFEAKSGADGRFRIDTLPPGVYELDVVSPSYADARIPDVATGSGELVIQLGDGGTILGTVVEGEKPIANAAVRVVANEDKFQIPIPVPGVNDALEGLRPLLEEEDRARLTSSEGAFLWQHLRPGSYELRIDAPGYLPLARDVAVADGQRVDLGRIPLDKGSVVRGRVITSRKAPVAGATIAAQPETGNQMQTIMGALGYVTGRTRATTDANGEFALSGLARSATAFRVVATHPRFGMGSAGGVKPEGEPVEITLTEPWQVAGKVVRAQDKQPVARAEVYGGGAETKTDEEGRFVLAPVVPDANPMLFASFAQGQGQGQEGRRRIFGGQAKDGQQPRVQVPASAARGEPTLRVFARAEGLSPRDKFLTEKDLDKELVIELAEEIRVEGIVRTPDGEAKAGVLVRLVPGQLPPIGGMDMITLGVAISGPDGKFSFGQLRGPFELRASASFPGYATAQSESFWIGRDTPPPFIELQLGPGGAIVGTVTNAADRSPLAGIKLRLHAAQEKGEVGRVGIFLAMFGIPEAGDATYSNTEGRFGYTDITPGEYMVTATAGAGISRSVKVDVVPNETAEVAIELDVGGTITGVVIDRAGGPVAFASVRLLDSGNSSLAGLQKAFGGSTARQSTDALGAFTFSQVRKGTYSVLAEKEGFAPREVGELHIDAEPVRVVLEAEGAILGYVVRGGSGEAVTAFKVRIDKNEKGNRWNSPMKAMRAIDHPEGVFAYEGLSAGEYLLEVRADGAAPATVTATVESGKETAVEVVLDIPCSVAGKVVLDGTETPVPRARVALVSSKPADASNAAEAFGGFMESRVNEIATTTREDGTFTLENLPPGQLELEATHNVYRPGKATLTVAPGEQGTCTIGMREGFGLAGTVLDFEGNPEPERAILLEGPDRIQKVTRSDGAGIFKFSGLKAGKYRLWCPTPDLSAELPPQDLDVAADTEGIVLTLPPPADQTPPGEVPAGVPGAPELPEALKGKIDPAKMKPKQE